MRRCLPHALLLLFGVAFTAAAQQPHKVLRVAFVASTSPVSELNISDSPAVRGFVQGLREGGYFEGRNLVMEWRSAEGRFERFPGIIRELLPLKVDIIVTVNNVAARAAKNATQAVPIVMLASIDPVGEGLVQSLARPGGNITGLAWDTGAENDAKRVQVLKEIFPRMTRMAYLGSREGGDTERRRSAADSAVQGMGVKFLFAEHSPTQYAEAFALIARERPDAMLVAQSAANFANRRMIVDFATKSRLPAIYPNREFADAGGFISLGVDATDASRLAAGYVVRILKGAKPADLPVERPTKFELVVNLKTAKALGVAIPPSVLVRADRIIE